MQITRRTALAGAAAIAAMPLARARAQAKPTVKIGVLTDLGSTFSSDTGENCIVCARQAISDFNPSSHGFDVELIQADHQQKPDVGASIARQWYDQGVDVILDVPNSSVALAVADVTRQKDKILLSEAVTTELTDGQCSPNTIGWSLDTYTLAKSNGAATVKGGGKSWYFVSADYTFGHILQSQTAAIVKESGGVVEGAAFYPFPDTADFSPYLLQAQASGAQVLGLGVGGNDVANSIKQANEFGLNKSMKIVPLLAFITQLHGLGDLVEGLNVTTSFYWDFNDRTRAFTRRVLPNMANGSYPNCVQASNYGMAFHYLKTVAAMGAANAKQSGAETVARMKGIPTDDDAFGKGSIRADGRGEFPAYLWRTKRPSKPGGWDLFEHVQTTPASEALHPMNAKCNFRVAT